MREISTKKIEFGEHVMMDGVECVIVDGECGNCEWQSNCVISAICPVGGKLEKVKPEPKYRPYNDTDELIADCESRFNKISAANSMPLIWVMKNKLKAIITDYAKYAVSVFGKFQSLETLYKEYTYLDGSPCGKEI